MSGTRRYGSRRPAGSVVVGDNDNGYVETDPTGRYGRVSITLHIPFFISRSFNFWCEYGA